MPQTPPRKWAGKENENDMAIYQFSAKMVTRGSDCSACAAAAYMSCSEITNEYDGIHHDYTCKSGLV